MLMIPKKEYDKAINYLEKLLEICLNPTVERGSMELIQQVRALIERVRKQDENNKNK